MAAKSTPVMRQHAEAKAAYPDAIIFFRLGDFYEMFGEDAVTCAELLNLTLTSRNKGKPDEIPMAGVPHHAAHTYIGRLLQLGRRVAICEQMADPKTVKGIVPRAVVRVISPGLITHEEHLAAGENNWLAAISLGPRVVGVALLDISTGEFKAAQAADIAALAGELVRAAPKEVLIGTHTVPADERAHEVEALLKAALPGAAHVVEPVPTEGELSQLFGELWPEAERLSTEERAAAALALRFARRCTPEIELPLRRIGRWDPAATLVLDVTAQQHLELVRSNADDPQASLLAVVNRTRTAAGARLLRSRLLAPLLDVAAIRRRHDAVEFFVNASTLRAQVREALSRVGDMERIASRVVMGEASPRELGLLRNGLSAGADVFASLAGVENATEREALGDLDVAPELVNLRVALEAALVEQPPALAKEGEIFQPGFDAELARYQSLKQDGAALIVDLERRLREQTDINNLRVRFTRVFGWYVEVARSRQKQVPSAWRRKQTVATGERYTLDELDDLAAQVAEAGELHRARELELLRELNGQVRESAQALRTFSARLAEVDVAAALAEVAHRYDYVRPEVDDSDELKLEEARHPVVECLAASGAFVPNDVRLTSSGERIWLVTGPNMAGKSTFLRQTALCVILAQMGSFVPARRAKIGVVDRVLSRVGASDNLARGDSTFMVEMKETADILHFATPRSLVILDEIGRGTSTFDGLSIAWAVLEHLDVAIRCRALFATHYHELTALADDSTHVANCSVAAREQGGAIVFLHRVIAGPASRSYGVAVAKLAGLPQSVLARAEAVLKQLEGEQGLGKAQSRARTPRAQLSLFEASVAREPKADEVLDTVRGVDLDQLSPMQAHGLLVKLQRLLKR